MRSKNMSPLSALRCFYISLFLLGFAAARVSSSRAVMDQIERINSDTGRSLKILQILTFFGETIFIYNGICVILINRYTTLLLCRAQWVAFQLWLM